MCANLFENKQFENKALRAFQTQTDKIQSLVFLNLIFLNFFVQIPPASEAFFCIAFCLAPCGTKLLEAGEQRGAAAHPGRARASPVELPVKYPVWLCSYPFSSCLLLASLRGPGRQRDPLGLAFCVICTQEN